MTLELQLPIAEWERVAGGVVPFVHDDESYGYGNLLLVADGRRRTWVGADDHLMVVLGGGPTTDVGEVLVPIRLVSAALALGSAPEDGVALSVGDEELDGRPLVSVATATGRVAMPVGTGSFPDWEEIVAACEAVPRASAEVDRDVFCRLVDEARRSPGGVDLARVSPLFWLEVEPGVLRIVVDCPRFGPSTFTVASRTQGRARLSVNPRYLVALLGACERRGTVRLCFDATPRGLLTLSDGTGWSGYLMPLDTTAEAIRPWVERVLADAFNLGEVTRDEDGDYPIPFGPAPLYARLTDGTPHRLQLFTVALDGVPGSEQLFAELNSMNTNLGFARAIWTAGQVLFETELEATDVEPDGVIAACTRVAELAASLGPVLDVAFGAGSA